MLHFTLLLLSGLRAAHGILHAAHGISLRSTHAPYHWPHARGHPGSYSTTEFVGPASTLNTSLAWSWHHPNGTYATVVVGGPLIDDKSNIYIASEDGIRKFNVDGKQLWFYSVEAPISTCPSLMDGALFGNTMAGVVFSLDMETGKERWARKHAVSVSGDTAYVESHDGIVITSVNSNSTASGGALSILGLDATDGDKLWEFESSVLIWNTMPQFTSDKAVIFMGVTGAVFKLDLQTGRQLWSNLPPLQSFSDGGVILGPDNTAFTCSNYDGSGNEGSRGAVRAFAPQDGHMLWEQILDKPCNSWPAVTNDGKLVVVPSGVFVSDPAAANVALMKKFEKSPTEMSQFSLSLGTQELQTYGMPERTATIRALDAKTGELVWAKDLTPYGRLAAAGDEEGYALRLSLHHRPECLPAQFSAPTISGDGTIYVGRSDGNLYAIKPEGSDAVVNTFHTGAGFLHPGTSFAPGMMAVTSCDGLFVWKY